MADISEAASAKVEGTAEVCVETVRPLRLCCLDNVGVSCAK